MANKDKEGVDGDMLTAIASPGTSFFTYNNFRSKSIASMHTAAVNLVSVQSPCPRSQALPVCSYSDNQKVHRKPF